MAGLAARSTNKRKKNRGATRMYDSRNTGHRVQASSNDRSVVHRIVGPAFPTYLFNLEHENFAAREGLPEVPGHHEPRREHLRRTDPGSLRLVRLFRPRPRSRSRDRTSFFFRDSAASFTFPVIPTPDGLS